MAFKNGVGLLKSDMAQCFIIEGTKELPPLSLLLLVGGGGWGDPNQGDVAKV